MSTTTTENGMPALTTTGTKCLDFFSSVVRDTPTDKVVSSFEAAYTESPEIAMKILMNLRDCTSGNGKQEKRVSYDALVWLRRNHLKTYLANLDTFVKLGCFKDLLQIMKMVRGTEGATGITRNYEAEYFAQCLNNDYDTLTRTTGNTGNTVGSISLAGKWAPSENSHWDNKVNGDCYNAIYKRVNNNKRQYRKIIVALRKHLNVLERNLSLKTYDNIKFEQIPARAMKNNKSVLQKYCTTRFEEYLKKLVEGKTKINFKGIQPHILVEEVMRYYPDEDTRLDKCAIAEQQWKAIVSDLRKTGLFERSIAVCDVSGSMSGIPMNVSIALGLVLSELAPEGSQFANRIITFSANPKWYTITGTSLYDRAKSLSKAEWGMNTDFIAVFNMLLDDAKKYALKPEQMPSNIFVFSDMQFDEALGANAVKKYKCAYDHVKDLYTKNGYTVPTIVFWNLRDTRVSFPVAKDTPGVALMSGFSSEMLKVFMQCGSNITPEVIMLKSLESYHPVILD